jgi:hypothetical protein
MTFAIGRGETTRGALLLMFATLVAKWRPDDVTIRGV